MDDGNCPYHWGTDRRRRNWRRSFSSVVSSLIADVVAVIASKFAIAALAISAVAAKGNVRVILAVQVVRQLLFVVVSVAVVPTVAFGLESRAK